MLNCERGGGRGDGCRQTAGGVQRGWFAHCVVSVLHDGSQQGLETRGRAYELGWHKEEDGTLLTDIAVLAMNLRDEKHHHPRCTQRHEARAEGSLKQDEALHRFGSGLLIQPGDKERATRYVLESTLFEAAARRSVSKRQVTAVTGMRSSGSTRARGLTQHSLVNEARVKQLSLACRNLNDGAVGHRGEHIA